MCDIAQKVQEIVTLNASLDLLREELATVELLSFNKLLADIRPIMTFISDRLITSNTDSLVNDFMVKSVATYFDHNGICLYNGYDSQTINEFETKLSGHKLFYCTDNKLYIFERDGITDTTEGIKTINYSCKVSEVSIDNAVKSFDVEDIISTVRDLLYGVVRELQTRQSTETKLIDRLKNYLENTN